MNLEVYMQISQEKIQALRQEASIISQLKSLLAPRPMKHVKTLKQFEQRRAST